MAVCDDKEAVDKIMSEYDKENESLEKYRENRR